MKWTVLLGLAALSQVAVALRASNLLYQSRIKNQIAAGGNGPSSTGKDTSSVSQQWILLPLDHSGKDTRQFWGQYWVYADLWKPGAPIFFYDGGEGEAESWAARMLEEEQTFFHQLLKKFNGMGIVWEHRYYGRSTPVDVTTATAADMKFLTVDQALADIPVMVNNFTRPELGNHDLTPKGTPWVYVGGSYPGTRATFMREKYPDVFFASWAASAPVQARVEMGEYFEQISRGLKKWGFTNCTANSLMATNYVDGELGSNDTNRQNAVKQLLLGPGSESNPPGAIADALMSVFYGWQSNGIDGDPNLRSFCDWISTDEQGRVSPAGGWNGIKTPKWVAQRWASWKYWVSTVNSDMGTTCVGPSVNGTAPDNPVNGDIDCDLTGLITAADGISWTWQYCSQWGFYQQANFGPDRIISRYDTLAHQQEMCDRQFPGAFPKGPDVNSIVGEYQGWNARVSNVMFTGGEFDPWRTMSELSMEPFSGQFTITQDIPECGEKTDADTVFGFLVPDGCHCYDMDPYYEPGEPARQLFVDALNKWLKSWAPNGKWPGSGKRH